MNKKISLGTVIALIAVPVYFTVFALCDLAAHKKGEHFYSKAKTTG